jgi:hypothetical protein
MFPSHGREKRVLQDSELRQDFIPKSDKEQVKKSEMHLCR